MYRFTGPASFILGQAKRLAREESGATAIEYAMIAVSVAVAIVIAVNTLGTTTAGLYASVEAGLR